MRGAAPSRPLANPVTTHVGMRPTARPVPPGPITEPELPAFSGPSGVGLNDQFEIARGAPPAEVWTDALTGSGRPPFPETPPEPEVRRPVLVRGRIGLSVRRMQRALHRLGLLSSETLATGAGVFGPKTEQAVQELQRRCGLEPTGRMDTQTGFALRQALRDPHRL